MYGERWATLPEGVKLEMVVSLPGLLLVSALAYSSISHCFPAFAQPQRAPSDLKV